METVTPAEPCASVDQLLDEVLISGSPIEIKMGDRRLRIAPVTKPDQFLNLTARPDVILGDPEELANLSWDVVPKVP